MIVTKEGHELVALDDGVYALGGSSSTHQYFSAVDKLDVTAQKWTDAPAMSEIRGWFGAVSK